MSEDLAMESKKLFAVFQPAEVWYRTDVWAGSEDEALAMAKHPTSKWEMDLTTAVAVDGDWDVVEYEATI